MVARCGYPGNSGQGSMKRRISGQSRRIRRGDRVVALSPGKRFSRTRALICSAAIAACAVAVYHNSFTGPFIFDDPESITENPNVRGLWPIWRAMWAPPGRTVSGRPVLALSLAVNYRISGEEVWSYHALNLAIHVLAGLTLFGIIRRTLLSERLRERFGGSSTSLGLICALIWVVHPLQTESVTYVIQRAESLMGLFYLLTLYCAIRGFESPRGAWWYAGAIAACAAGMGTKEVMATAPVMVLLYDRIFVSRSLRDISARRKWFYVALCLTWVILVALVWTSPRGKSAGFGIERVTALEYAATQPQVILHYIKLSFWPNPLVLDYRWPVAKGFIDAGVPAALLGAIVLAVVLALRYRPAAGFAGVWFFGILLPTSSFIPIFDLAFEHRMYLSLGALVASAVLCANWIGRKVADRIGSARHLRPFAYVLAGLLIAALGLVSHRRNEDYRSDIAIWEDTIQKRPDNARAYSNRAMAYKNQGAYDLAMKDYNTALEMNPGFGAAYNGRGVIHSYLGQYDLAIADFTKAIKLDAEDKRIRAYNNRGIAFTRKGMYDRGIADCTKAIELDPQYCRAYTNRAVAYGHKGMHELAIRDCTRAIELRAKYAKAYNNRAVAYDALGKRELAIRDFTRTVELDPGFSSAYSGRGLIYAKSGHYHLAICDFEKALELNPKDEDARKNRELAITLQRESESNR